MHRETFIDDGVDVVQEVKPFICIHRSIFHDQYIGDGGGLRTSIAKWPRQLHQNKYSSWIFLPLRDVSFRRENMPAFAATMSSLQRTVDHIVQPALCIRCCNENYMLLHRHADQVSLLSFPWRATRISLIKNPSILPSTPTRPSFILTRMSDILT